MSIKNAIKRLEHQIAKNRSGQFVTFIIPYCKEASQTEAIKKRLIKENSLENKGDILVIFVVNFAMAA
jgi:hypothetical protein